MEKEPKTYEIGYLITPLMPEEKLDEEISVLRGFIEGNQGLITAEERAKMQKLSYEIEKPGMGRFNSAYFGWIKFMASPSVLDEIKKSLDKDANVLRFLAVESEKETAAQKPSAPRMARRKPAAAGAPEKTEVKTEEIDKKLEELIGK